MAGARMENRDNPEPAFLPPLPRVFNSKLRIQNSKFCFLLATLLAGCSSEPLVDLVPPKVPPSETVVTVNGEPLSLEEFDSEFRLMRIHYSAVSGRDMQTIKRRLFEQVINRRLLVQEARRLGIRMTQAEVDRVLKEALADVPEDFFSILKVQGVSESAWKRKLLQERLAGKVVDQEVNAKVEISPEEVEDYYWTHLRESWLPETVRVRHLVVRKKKDLDAALREMEAGLGFPQAVGKYSEGMGAEQGGEWDVLAVEDLLPEHREALAGLAPGGISEPLRDAFGYHLFQLVERLPRRMQPFHEAKEGFHRRLLREEQDLRFEQWMAGLKRAAEIKVNEDMALMVGVDLEDMRDQGN